MKDTINPAHYCSQPVECIEFTECMNFCMGNAFKYLWRFPEKNGVEDLQKAKWYLERQIHHEPYDENLLTETWMKLSNVLSECSFSGRQAAALKYIWDAAYCDNGFLVQALNEVNALIEEIKSGKEK